LAFFRLPGIHVGGVNNCSKILILRIKGASNTTTDLDVYNNFLIFLLYFFYQWLDFLDKSRGKCMGVLLCKYINQTNKNIYWFTEFYRLEVVPAFKELRVSQEKKMWMSQRYSMLSVVTELIHTAGRTYIKYLYYFSSAE